jgi:hypothetical protein
MSYRVLLSYHYFRNVDLDAAMAQHFGAGPLPEVFADSGAYSAWKLGATIDVVEYAAWVRRWSHLFTTYANLDVIGDAERAASETAANQRILEEAGLTPLPVFHAGEPWEALDALLERGYDYIGLGGLVGRRAKAIAPWLVKVFTRAEGKAVFHGFGLTNLNLSRSFGFYSLDSTTWANGHRYGEVQLWDERSRSVLKLSRAYSTSAEVHDEVYRHADLLRAHGGDPSHFAQREFNVSIEGKSVEQMAVESTEWTGVNVQAWVLYEDFLRRHHDVAPPKGFSRRGPVVYLAGITLEALGDIQRSRAKEAV